MKSLIILFCLLLVQTGLPIKSVFAQQDPDYQIEVEENTICSFINSNRVNVRQRPNIDSPVVTRLNRGDGVRVIGRTGDWVQIVARDSGKRPTPIPPFKDMLSINTLMVVQKMNLSGEDNNYCLPSST